MKIFNKEYSRPSICACIIIVMFFSLCVVPVWAKTELAERNDSEKSLKSIHDIIDQLRVGYPGKSFLCIPQGRWMTALWRVFKEGDIPEISMVKRVRRPDKKNTGSSLFNDNRGHGGPITPARNAAHNVVGEPRINRIP